MKWINKWFSYIKKSNKQWPKNCEKNKCKNSTEGGCCWKKYTPAGNRTLNLFLRRETPYPFGHRSFHNFSKINILNTKYLNIHIKRQLEEIKEIIIIIVYNETKKEIHFKIGDKNSLEFLKKYFEYKPTSRKDHFEYIKKGVNEINQVFDIGSKVLPLDDIILQEEYLI